MSEARKPRGPWIHRFAIFILAIVFGILVWGSEKYIVNDIRGIEGPDWDEVFEQRVDQDLVDRQEALEKEIGEKRRALDLAVDEQKVVQQGSQNLQSTLDQLIDLQKLKIEEGVPLPEEQKDLTASLDRFLQEQTKFQEMNDRISRLTGEKGALEAEMKDVGDRIEEQRKPALEEYKDLVDAHRSWLALIESIILIPFLLVGTFLLVRKRSSMYFPMFLAFGIATLVMVVGVITEYLPEELYKYILMGFAILAVGALLVYFIRIVARPKARSLRKQYRQAYERFLCPVCEYPIRVGPRRFLFWTRRTAQKSIRRGVEAPEEEYTCPSCGTTLMETCSACEKVRHSLLGSCQHCGDTKEVT